MGRNLEYTRPQKSSPDPKITARTASPRPIVVAETPCIRNCPGSLMLPLSRSGDWSAHSPRMALMASHVGANRRTLRLVAILQ